MSDTYMPDRPDYGKPSKSAKPAEPSKEDRLNALIASYAHGMENNAPRNPAELAELQALTGHKSLATVQLEPAQYAARDAMVSASSPRITVYDALTAELEVGQPVPATVVTAAVTPAMVALYPDWKGDSYFMVGDEIFLVDPMRKLVAIVGAPDRSKLVPPTPEQVKQREAAQKAEADKAKHV